MESWDRELSNDIWVDGVQSSSVPSNFLGRVETHVLRVHNTAVPNSLLHAYSTSQEDSRLRSRDSQYICSTSSIESESRLRRVKA